MYLHRTSFTRVQYIDGLAVIYISVEESVGGRAKRKAEEKSGCLVCASGLLPEE